MITLSAEQIEKIYRRVFSGSGFPPSDSAFYRTVQSTIEEINRIESPEPISTPRIATVTDLGNDTLNALADKEQTSRNDIIERAILAYAKGKRK